MIMAHRIALNLNNVQASYMARSSGVARFAYNWALAEWGRQYEAYKLDNSLPKPSEAALRRQLNSIKREQFPWMLKVSKNAPQMAIMQLGDAFKNFFAGRSKYPKFHKKGVRDSFTLTNDQFKVRDMRIRVPYLGWVRMREALRLPGKIMSATISREANRWFVSISVDVPDEFLPPKTKKQGVVGVDLGISALATLSTGEIVVGPKAYRALMSRLQRESSSLCRKQKESGKYKKAKMRLAKLHARIANIRRDALHKLTTRLTSEFDIIVIENLNVKGMMKNHRLARSIADMGFFEFRRQLEYKAKMRGGQIIIVDRFFPSSKMCSSCGYVLKELLLSTRKWVCPECGTAHDRDVNAAINLRNMAVSSTASARGEEGSGRRRKTVVKPASVKREVSSSFSQ